jgi:hypothetical protein
MIAFEMLIPWVSDASITTAVYLFIKVVDRILFQGLDINKSIEKQCSKA